MGPVRFVRRLWALHRFNRLQADFARREADAKRRHCTRDLGSVRKERTDTVHRLLAR